ncbi:hypothetical protein KSP39_PZI009396 [Platanthera zijinensis]|uniref:Transmembrane protein n=1 Tax=Platanthera zijinensis TaxID=2320716 RepID=A0AAP0BML1_9ASPA
MSSRTRRQEQEIVEPSSIWKMLQAGLTSMPKQRKKDGICGSTRYEEGEEPLQLNVFQDSFATPLQKFKSPQLQTPLYCSLLATLLCSLFAAVYSLLLAVRAVCPLLAVRCSLLVVVCSCRVVCSQALLTAVLVVGLAAVFVFPKLSTFFCRLSRFERFPCSLTFSSRATACPLSLVRCGLSCRGLIASRLSAVAWALSAVPLLRASPCDFLPWSLLCLF